MRGNGTADPELATVAAKLLFNVVLQCRGASGGGIDNGGDGDGDDVAVTEALEPAVREHLRDTLDELLDVHDGAELDDGTSWEAQFVGVAHALRDVLPAPAVDALNESDMIPLDEPDAVVDEGLLQYGQDDDSWEHK